MGFHPICELPLTFFTHIVGEMGINAVNIDVALEAKKRGVKLYIHPSHNVPGDTTAAERLDACIQKYKALVAGV